MKQKQFENIWAKNNKMKCRLQDWVRVRGLEPTYEICRDYWMGKIKAYLNPYTGNVEHLNTRIEGKQIQRIKRGDNNGKPQRVSGQDRPKNRRFRK
jgi:nitrate reductase beta subunit